LFPRRQIRILNALVTVNTAVAGRGGARRSARVLLRGRAFTTLRVITASGQPVGMRAEDQ
jgi:hypothetical protein